MELTDSENIVKILEYNTHREKMILPEYGRSVQKMVEQLKTVPDRQKRSEQARAIVRIMELLNPSVHTQENWEHTLWDNLYIIAGCDLDIDAPYPMPQKNVQAGSHIGIKYQKTPIKATHYGRNIESIIELIACTEEGEVKTAMLRDLAMYMRTQYLIWNKDSVNDKTIFQDIEKLSGGRIAVPEDLELTELSHQASYSRPGMSSQGGQQRNKNFKHNGRRPRK